jgi:hypothetical protein
MAVGVTEHVDKRGKRTQSSYDADDCTFVAPMARLLYKGVVVSIYLEADDWSFKQKTVPCFLNKINTRCLANSSQYLEAIFGPIGAAIKHAGWKWQGFRWVPDKPFVSGELLDSVDDSV